MDDSVEVISFTVADLKTLLVVMGRVVPPLPDEVDYLTRYLILMSNYVRELLESFVVLEEAGCQKAGAVIARTVLESTVRLRASSRNPEVCLQIACSEVDEHIKWLSLLDGSP